MRYSKEELDKLREKFPARFQNLPCTVPPRDSEPMYIEGYRLCNKSDELSDRDFLSYDMDKPDEVKRKNSESDPSSYGVSILRTIERAKVVQGYHSNRKKKIVFGYVKEKYGFVKIDNSKHLNLWLYEEAKPWEDFKDKEE